MFFLNAMVKTGIIKRVKCAACGSDETVAAPAVIDVDKGVPGLNVIHHQLSIPRWGCDLCRVLTPISTDHFLMALDYRADAVQALQKRKTVNRRVLEISLMLKVGDPCPGVRA